jgi:hypothetical protein
MLQTISRAIDELGASMVSCRQCSAASTAAHGTPPRCLWFEQATDAQSGVIAVGLNPGKASLEEISFYEQQGVAYEGTVDYLRREAKRIPYFIAMRRLVRAAFGIRHIHWTEVAKCELRQGEPGVPLDMRRKCIELHLKKELLLLPRDWPVVAAGRVAFEVMSVLCTERPVIGVPHPTGSFGRQFSGLFVGNGLAPNLAQQVAVAVRSNGASWLVAGDA